MGKRRARRDPVAGSREFAEPHRPARQGVSGVALKHGRNWAFAVRSLPGFRHEAVFLQTPTG